MAATEAGSARILAPPGASSGLTGNTQATDWHGLVIRTMRPDHAEAALHLSEEAGWNQTIADWRFMLGQGHAVGVWEPDCGWVASSLTLPLGPDLSWISMVLVTRRQRRRGFGTKLLQRCIDSVREKGAVPGLDATEIGRPVYLPLGFEDVYTISRWRLDGPISSETPPAGTAIRPMGPDDLDPVIAFDAQHTHMQRGATLHYLLGLVPNHACLAEANGKLVGYALGRPGRTATQIGPVIADNATVALALSARMTALGGSAILDVPDAHRDLADWLRGHGAIRERGYTRMTLGRFPGLEDVGSIYALAGPELS
jgi:GNAT superfamily N-acetyltransferase